MNALPIVVALVFLAQIIAAPALAGPRDLNDPARAVEREDVAPIKKAKKIPYETIEKENFSVSYNLQVRDDGLGPVYRLSLIMRNNTGEGVRIEPKLTLLDRDGLAIRPKSYEAVRSEAFALAGVASAPLPVSTRGGSRYSEGTITNTTTGERHSYTARSSTTGNFSDSFATGYAIGAQARARRNMDDAFTLVTWAADYWLESKYVMPGRTAVSGALLYPGSKKPALPFRLIVELGDEVFEFQTAAKK